jgi:hypothetical protein
MKQSKCILFIAAAAIVLAGASCKKDNNTDPSTRTRISAYVEKDGRGIVYVTDLPGDTTATPGSPGKNIYFSLGANGTVDSSKKLTTSWDLAFTNIYNSYVTINNGTNPISPGYGGSAQGQLYIVNLPFDSVKTVPAGSAVNVNGSAGMDGYPSASWPGWYQYNPSTHLMTTIQGKTLVVKLAGGKYAKVEMTTLYKGNPASPSISTPVPYFTYRYWVQQDGSTNLVIP